MDEAPRVKLVQAAGDSAQGSTWANDDRFVVDLDANVFALARAKGPTYGGYHLPVAVDAALGTFTAYLADRNRIGLLEERVRSALAMAIDAGQTASDQHRSDALMHPTWSITALVVEERSAVLVHLGVNRCYRRRQSATELLTRDDSVAETSDAAHESFRFTESRLLGYPGQAELPEVTALDLEPGDRFVLASPGVWSRKHSVLSVNAAELWALSSAELCGCLLEEPAAGLDASAIAILVT